MKDDVRSGVDRGAGLLTVALCCAAMVLEGFCIQVPGVTAPTIAPLFGMTPADRGLFLGMSTFGMMFGAVIGGWFSDRIGRKWVLVASVALFGLLSLLTTLAASTQMLLWMRFITGVGLGGALPNLISMAAEGVTDARRNTAVGFLLASPPVGGALVSLLAATASRPDQWKLIYYVAGLAPLLLIVPLLAFLLPNIRKAAPAEGQAADGGFVFALFGEGRAARTVVLWVGFFCVLLILFLLLGWLPSLMVSRGLSRSAASLVQTAFNLCSIPASIAAGALIDKTKGSTVSVIGVFVAAGAALGLLATGSGSLLVSLLLGGLAGATVTSAQTLIYGLAPACYPIHVRGKGVGVCVAIGRFGSAGGPLIAGVLVGAGRGPGQVLMALLPIIAVSGAAAVFLARSIRRKAQLAEGDVALAVSSPAAP